MSGYLVYDKVFSKDEVKDRTAKTYIWTFNKQSDGKYYYYSSDWQN